VLALRGQASGPRLQYSQRALTSGDLLSLKPA
jgi:hypothetical protein